MNKVPKFLYHYTTVESLALILKNKTIKFNPLTVLDDLEEEKIADLTELANFIFVSSWMDDDTESIPMWKMYSDMRSGVRIKLPVFPFKEYEWTKEGILGLGETGIFFEDLNDKRILPIEEMVNDKYSMVPYMQNDLLQQVIYTDDEKLLCPKIYDISKDSVRIAMNKLGVHKNSNWSFQKEWRYIFKFVNTGVKQINEQFKKTGKVVLNDFRDGLPFNSYFLKIDEDILNQMEITLSPNISDGNKIIIEELVKSFSNSTKIITSCLYNRIR